MKRVLGDGTVILSIFWCFLFLWYAFSSISRLFFYRFLRRTWVGGWAFRSFIWLGGATDSSYLFLLSMLSIIQLLVFTVHLLLLPIYLLGYFAWGTPSKAIWLRKGVSICRTKGRNFEYKIKKDKISLTESIFSYLHFFFLQFNEKCSYFSFILHFPREK